MIIFMYTDAFVLIRRDFGYAHQNPLAEMSIRVL